MRPLNRRLRQSSRIGTAVLVLALACLLTAPVRCPRCRSPHRLAGPITDDVNALSGSTSEVQAAFNDLQDATGTQLWVWFTDTLGGAGSRSIRHRHGPGERPWPDRSPARDRPRRPGLRLLERRWRRDLRRRVSRTSFRRTWRRASGPPTIPARSISTATALQGGDVQGNGPARDDAGPWSDGGRHAWRRLDGWDPGYLAWPTSWRRP